jgi:hypothetical protein
MFGKVYRQPQKKGASLGAIDGSSPPAPFLGERLQTSRSWTGEREGRKKEGQGLTTLPRGARPPRLRNHESSAPVE